MTVPTELYKDVADELARRVEWRATMLERYPSREAQEQIESMVETASFLGLLASKVTKVLDAQKPASAKARRARRRADRPKG